MHHSLITLSEIVQKVKLELVSSQRVFINIQQYRFSVSVVSSRNCC